MAKIRVIYSAVSITAPVLGVIIGGIVLNKLGGYTHKNAPKMVLVLSGTVIFFFLMLGLLDGHSVPFYLQFDLQMFGYLDYPLLWRKHDARNYWHDVKFSYAIAPASDFFI